MQYRSSMTEQATYASLERGERLKFAVWRGGIDCVSVDVRLDRARGDSPGIRLD